MAVMAIRKNSSRDAHRVRAFLLDSVRLWVTSVQVTTNAMMMMRADSVLRGSALVCRHRLLSVRAISLVSREEAILSVRAISHASRAATVLGIIRMAISSREAISSGRAVTVVRSRVATSSARAAIVSAQPTTIPMQSIA